MKKHIGLLAAASALALFGAQASADHGEKPEKERAASSEHGKSGARKVDKEKERNKDEDRSGRDDGNDADCGLGRREDGETGARDPWAERDGDCKAAEEYGDREHGKDHDDGEDGDHDRNDADAPEEKTRSWRWPWERDN